MKWRKFSDLLALSSLNVTYVRIQSRANSVSRQFAAPQLHAAGVDTILNVTTVASGFRGGRVIGAGLGGGRGGGSVMTEGNVASAPTLPAFERGARGGRDGPAELGCRVRGMLGRVPGGLDGDGLFSGLEGGGGEGECCPGFCGR